MELILKMSAREALDSIEAGLVTPLLELCAGKADKPATPAPTPAPVIGPGSAPATPVAPAPIAAVPVEAAPVAAPSAWEDATPAPAAVPTEAHVYTRDELAIAAGSLMEAGKQADLRAALQQFGIASLVMLPEEQFGAFATTLRGLGAQI